MPSDVESGGVGVDHTDDQRSSTAETNSMESTSAFSPVSSEQSREETAHSSRRRRRTRSRRRSTVRSPSIRYEKALLHFGAALIVLGIVCILLQMVQFTNHSILSETQPGLWCGTLFAITGSVCIALARTKGVYSVIAMLCFSIVSLFMALTLASLSWFGAEMAVRCQSYWEYYCVEPPTDNWNASTPLPFEDFTSSSPFNIGQQTMVHTFGNVSESTETPPTSGLTCADISHGYCGYDIALGRTMHSLLMLAGIVGATISFVLATLACSRPNEDASHRSRYPSIYTIHGDVPASVRPITPWEFPPPSKEPLPENPEGFDPEEPPPPYEEQDNTELQTHL